MCSSDSMSPNALLLQVQCTDPRNALAKRISKVAALKTKWGKACESDFSDIQRRSLDLNGRAEIC